MGDGPDLSGGATDLGRGASDLGGGSADLAHGPADLASPPGDLGSGQLCVVRPQQTEGPYFVDEKLLRSDIRSDPSDGTVKSGAALRLAFTVSRLSGSACTPLAGANVDVWHADALGVYSDVVDTNGQFDTTGKKFLRGYQVTDAGGASQFLTIFPGWYTGRTVHIHFKVRAKVSGVSYAFTSQLYFEDALTDAVQSQPPYNSKGTRTTKNAQDGIYRQGGSQLLLQPVKNAQGEYAATFNLALQI